jgi:hypothetical protein
MFKQGIYIGVLALLMTGCFVGVRAGGPGPYVNGAFYYDYYPESEVYYSVDRHLYYYYSGGGWVGAATLPGTISLSVGAPVRIQVGNERPYVLHEEHLKRYPPGQLKKRNKGWR